MRRSLLLALLVTPLTACVTLSNTARSYLTAPNGLQVDDERVRTLLRTSRADSALRAVSNRKSTLSPDDRLLRLLYQGTAARYAGRNRDAGLFFDQAFAVSEDRFTKSISRTAAAMVSNDYALPYTAGQNERLLLHYNALLAWSADGDADAAAVEARRLVALLARIGEPDDQERPMRAAMHTVAAAAFEQSGDWSDADVARRNAIRLGASLDSMLTAPDSNSGDLLVVVERGDVAHKVAVGLTIPIYSDDNAGDRGDGSRAAQRMLADFGAMRNGGVWWDDTPSWRFTSSRYGALRGASASYLLDMSWPVLRRSFSVGAGAVRVSADGVTGSAMPVVSISDAIASDYRRDRGAVMSRTVARAVTKYAAVKAMEAAATAAASKDDSGDRKDDRKQRDAKRAAGMVAKFATNVAMTALERADTRAWTLLPSGVSVVRMRLPAGTHELLVDAAGTRQLSLPGVVVRGGRTTIVSARLWREPVEGIRTMVERAATNEPAPER